MSGLRKIFLTVVTTMACTMLLSLLHVVYSPIKTRAVSSVYNIYEQMREGIKELKTLKNDARPHTKLIILTYMRSGSTLTGSFFAHHADVFYLFEPFHSLDRIKAAGESDLLFFNRPRRKMSTLTMFHDELQRALEAFLDCRFLNLDLNSLETGMYFASNDTKPFTKCRSHGGIVTLLRCLRELYSKCKHSQMTVLKTIRMPMKIVGRLMREDPHIKVIHLIRDPRATLKSQWDFKALEQSGRMKDFFKEFCEQVNDDLESRKILTETYPDRVMSLFYEDLAVRPYEVVKQMYSFAGLEFTNRTNEFIKSVTESSSEYTDCTLCVQKHNSSKTSEEWRLKIKYDFAKAIDEQCTQVYTKLNIHTLENVEHLRNLSRSLRS